MHFQYPANWFWLLLAIPLLAVWALYTLWKRRAIKKLADARLVSTLLSGYSAARGRIKAGLVLLAIVLLSFSLLNLQKPSEQANGGQTVLDVMIALDVSNSMLAADVAPNRIEKARNLVASLAGRLAGNRVGIVAFAGEALLQLPLTTDANAVRMFVPTIGPGIVPFQGTNVEAALVLADSSMPNGAQKYKVVVLITDGEELEGDLKATTRMLRNNGVAVLPVGVGTPSGAELRTEAGDVHRDDKGNPVISRLNEAGLQYLAAETQGTYRLLGETDATVNNLMDEINNMDKKPVTNTNLINYYSYGYWLLLPALLLLLAEMLMGEKAIFAKRQTEASKKKWWRRSKAPAVATLLLCILLSAAELPAQTARSLERNASSAYRKGELQRAEQGYKKVLQKDASNPIASIGLANIDYRRGRYNEAAQQYEKLGANDKAGDAALAAAWNNKGLTHVQQKNLPKAIESFKQALRANPFDNDIRRNLNKALAEWEKQVQDMMKNKPDSNQQNKPEPKMKNNDAEDKLEALRQEEKRIREKLAKKPGRPRGEKDW
jgi:Ca-activated chloride channel family protein